MGKINMDDARVGNWAYIGESGVLHAVEEIGDNPRSYGDSYTEFPKFTPYNGLVHCGYPVVDGEEAVIVIKENDEVSGSHNAILALSDVISKLRKANNIK